MSLFTKHPKYYVFCDETGMGGELYYGFGALFMDYNRRGDFSRLWEEVQAQSPFGDEVKWSATNHRKLAYYKAIVDFFFRHPWMRFHCIRVKKSLVKKELHKGSFQLGQRKHYTMFLANKMAYFSKPQHRQWFRVKIDRLPYSYSKSSEVMQIIGKHITENAGEVDADIRIDEEKSGDWTGIQICDLLLGACLAPVQRITMSGPKLKLNRYIAGQMGGDWKTLKYDTMPDVWKLNIWYWKPAFAKRICQTETVFPIHKRDNVRRGRNL